MWISAFNTEGTERKTPTEEERSRSLADRKTRRAELRFSKIRISVSRKDVKVA